MKKPLFLDKDGTLIKNVPYNIDIKKTIFFPDVIGCLRQLQKSFSLIVVTNQSGVGRGYFTFENLAVYKKQFIDLLESYNIFLSGFYVCPHYMQNCLCRKPKMGLLKKALEELAAESNGSWMIGDVLDDIEAGNIIGSQTILLNNGGETEWLMNSIRMPSFIASSFTEATEHILRLQN